MLLLDEPLGALDLKLRKEMQLELKRIQHEVGITFVHVTHDQEEAMTMADRIVIMNGGHIEQLGTPTELYEQPRTAFVAGFLGVSNLLDGDGRRRRHRRADRRHRRSACRATRSQAGPARCRSAFGPEKLRIGGGDANSLAGSVTESAYIGVSTQYILDTPAGPVTVYVQNDRPGGQVATGERLDAQLEPGKHLRRRHRGEDQRMTSEAQAPALVEGHIATGDKGLKVGALGYMSNLVIAVASTAPAYSLAATLGFIVVISGVGVHAPAVLIVSFVPILLVSLGYRYLNKADPDAGTTFAWTTRAFGPWIGWMNGWAIFVADVIVMASLSVIAAQYSYLLVGWSGGEHSTAWIIVGAVVWIALMTAICYRGIELSAETQVVLLSAEILILGAFAVVAFVKVYNGTALPGALHVSGSWFNPFDIPFTGLILGVLLGIFIYWGWDSGVAVNEESHDPAEGPGKAAVLSTILLVMIYLVVATAAIAYAGTKFLGQNSNDVLNALGGHVFGSPWDKFLIVSVLTSASASTQTTILPTARTTLSMAKWGALPEVFGRIHPRFLTPTFSTLGMGALSAVWTALLVGFNSSQNVLNDSITALGFAVCFYYGFTGLACGWYYRRELFKSLRGFLLAGLLPVAGGAMMAFVFVKAFIEDSKQVNAYSHPLFGVQIPILIGIGGLLLGLPLMLLAAAKFRPFFRRKTEVAPPGLIP